MFCDAQRQYRDVPLARGVNTTTFRAQPKCLYQSKADSKMRAIGRVSAGVKTGRLTGRLTTCVPLGEQVGACIRLLHIHCNMARRLLATFGNSDHGRLGHGLASTSQLLPRVVATLIGEDIAQVSCGGAHTLAVTEFGTVFSFGLNDNGQLGHSPGQPFVEEPQPVALPEPAVSVSAGHFHSLAVTDSGRLWSWGRNSSGQLGRTGASLGPPAPVDALSDVRITSASAGLAHSLAVGAQGELYAWGSSKDGRLGLGAASFLSWFSSAESIPRQVRSLEDVRVRHASAGDATSVCIDADGRLYSWGAGHMWQLGQPEAAQKLDAPTLVPGVWGASCVSLAAFYGALVTQDGQVCTWGTNEHGVLGIGRASALASVRQPTVLEGFRAEMVSCGWQHALALTAHGRLFSWGWGGSMGDTYALDGAPRGAGGQLGLGDDFDRYEPHLIKQFEDQHGNIINLVAGDRESSSSWRVVDVSAGHNHSACILEGPS